MKTRTLDQVESTKAKAVRFVRDVLGDDERAEEIEDESPEDYAERKRIMITNPQRRLTKMATKADLEERVKELEDENEELQDRLDQIATLSVADEANEDESDLDDDTHDDDDIDEEEGEYSR